MIELKAPSAEYQKRSEEARSRPRYWVARAANRFANDIAQLIATMGLSRAALARRVGVRSAYVTKVLRGDGNYTLETMVKIAHALGCRLDVTLCPERGTVESESVGWRPVYASQATGLQFKKAYWSELDKTYIESAQPLIVRAYDVDIVLNTADLVAATPEKELEHDQPFAA